jgi:uncharacterized membrane protein YedE/YeeE
VPSKQAKVRCLVPVRVYPSKDKMVWFGAVLSAMVGCKVKVLGVVGVLCASKGLVLCAGAKQTKQGFGLSYNQKFGALVGAVRVYLTSKLWLGAWLGAKRKDKEQGVKE